MVHGPDRAPRGPSIWDYNHPMSHDRHRDLLQPKRALDAHAPDEGDEEARDFDPGEARLAGAVQRLAHDDAALVALLSTEVPPWQQHRARVVLTRTLGAVRARELMMRAIGRDPFAPTAGSRAAGASARPTPPRPAVASVAAQSGEAAGSERHEEEADEVVDSVMTALSGGLRGGMQGALRFGVPTNEVSGRAGQPLSAPLRGALEAAFGWDFSSVRLHTNAEAAAWTGGAGAAALTVGSDVHFGAHVGDPEAAAHRRLLIHELAHVVQQERGAGAAPRGASGVVGGGGRRPAASRLTAAPRVAHAAPKVTNVLVDTEIGLGKTLTAKAVVAGGAKAGGLKWSSSDPAFTITAIDAKQVRVSAPAAVLKGKGGTTFTLEAALAKDPADKFTSPKITLIEVTKIEFKPAPKFGGPYAYPGGFPASVAPKNSGDPNRDGVAGNTIAVDVTTAPAGRKSTVSLVKALGAALAGAVITPGAKTGKIGVRVAEDKTGTRLDDVTTVNAVPTRVASFGAQFPAAAGTYGGWNTVNFAMSHGKMDDRPVAEMITVGPRNDFGIIPNMGWHVAPTLAFSAPANQWTDSNATGQAHPKIDVNLYEGPGVKAKLPQLMIFKQTFHWMAWSGAAWSKAIATGKHRRSLIKSGKKYIFRTEQIFPGAAAKAFNDKYAGPPLIELSKVKAAPLAPPSPPATAIAADGKATGAVTVATTVPGRKVNWTVVAGGSVAFTAGFAGGPVAAAATVTATLAAGTTKVKVADTVHPNRFAQGTVKTVAVKLSGMKAPGQVKSPAVDAAVSVRAAPGGRTVNFAIDPAALAAGVMLAPAVPGAGDLVSSKVTRPAAFKGKVTITATDSVLKTKTATTTVNFK